MQPARVAGASAIAWRASIRVARPVAARKEQVIASSTPFHGKIRAEGRPEHPRQRWIEDEAWLTGSVVGAGRPMRIKQAVFPTGLRVEPRGQVEVEVVPAGSFEDQVGGSGDEGGETDNGGSEKAVEPAQIHSQVSEARPGAPSCPLLRACSWDESQSMVRVCGDGCGGEREREGAAVVVVIPLIAEVGAVGIAALTEDDVFG